jgi:PAS domain S-box-containing protein
LLSFRDGRQATKNIGSERMTPVPPSGADPLRLLIVDDDETDRRAVRRCLQRSGLSVAADEAGSAVEALTLVGNCAYDCALLDYYLPDMPGPSLFEQLRAVAPDMPIVMLTGRGDEDVAVELMKAGAADYLPKASMTPERLSAGVRHAVELARETLARTQAENALRAQESRFRTLANAIPQLAWMTDAGGARNWFNLRWFDYTGLSLEEVKGWGWRQVVHPDHIDRVVQLIRRSCETGEAWEDTYPLRGKDGTYRWFLSRCVPIRQNDGEKVGWLGTNTDVTSQKNTEAERERLLALAHEARSRAEQATKARDELLAIVAHDLRNPLHVILALAARLPPFIEGPKGRQYLEHVERSAGQMERLVRDLLDLSNIESGTFAVDLRPVELLQLLQEARERIDLSAGERNIEFNCEIDAKIGSVSADRDRLFQVIANLLGNAFKFTPEGGRVSLRAYEHEGDAEIVVQDTGSGIPPENLPRIFDRFWRGDRALRDSAGLGLAICKGIVEAHRGRIWVESSLGVGTAFYVRIPKPRA